MTREVKKPKALDLQAIGMLKASYEYCPNQARHCAHVWIDGMGRVLSPENARRIACWFQDFAAWSKSLEPEFDERNE